MPKHAKPVARLLDLLEHYDKVHSETHISHTFLRLAIEDMKKEHGNYLDGFSTVFKENYERWVMFHYIENGEYRFMRGPLYTGKDRGPEYRWRLNGNLLQRFKEQPDA
jgi:hypothetical protein